MTPAARLRAAAALFRRYQRIEATYDAERSVEVRVLERLHADVARWLAGEPKPAGKKRKVRK